MLNMRWLSVWLSSGDHLCKQLLITFLGSTLVWSTSFFSSFVRWRWKLQWLSITLTGEVGAHQSFPLVAWLWMICFPLFLSVSAITFFTMRDFVIKFSNKPLLLEYGEHWLIIIMIIRRIIILLFFIGKMEMEITLIVRHFDGWDGVGAWQSFPLVSVLLLCLRCPASSWLSDSPLHPASWLPARLGFNSCFVACSIPSKYSDF